MIEVLEQFTEGKNPDKPCEDLIVVSNGFCAVIDGSTSKSTKFSIKTSGRKAAEILAEAVRSLPLKASAKDCFAILTAAISCYIEENGLGKIVDANPEERSTASIAIYSDFCNEVWLIGDCQCRINGRTVTNSKIVDRILAEIRSDILGWMLHHGHSIKDLQQKDSGRMFILSALRDQCAFQNVGNAENLYAYTVIDGQEIDFDSIITVPVEKNAEVILASDGYPVLEASLSETESRLQDLLKADPLMIQGYKSTKGRMQNALSFDDRSYLRIEVK